MTSKEKPVQVIRTKGLGGVIETGGLKVKDILFFCKPISFSDSCVVVAIHRTLSPEGEGAHSYNLYLYSPTGGLTFINRYKGDFQAINVALEMCKSK